MVRTGFFPLNKQHFTVVTDDGHQLILRVEQHGNKAITTPLSNAQLGEYFRNCLGWRMALIFGEVIWRHMDVQMLRFISWMMNSFIWIFQCSKTGAEAPVL